MQNNKMEHVEERLVDEVLHTNICMIPLQEQPGHFLKAMLGVGFQWGQTSLNKT